MHNKTVIHNSKFTIQNLVETIHNRLTSKSDSPALDAQVLLSHVMGKPRSWILAHPEAEPTNDQQKILETDIKRVENGEPLPYVIGHWEFYGLEFKITPDTLIPRPETELLVEEALKWLQDHPGKSRVVDIGTGSGCIAISLAANMPDLQVVATDISSAALAIASSNAKMHRVEEQIEFVRADLLSIRQETFNLICANLPYIPTKTLESLEIYEREPTLALDGGPDGLSLIRRLLPQAAQNLVSGGLLLLEIETSLGKETVKLAQESFPTADIFLLSDLAGHNRLLCIQTADE